MFATKFIQRLLLGLLCAGPAIADTHDIGDVIMNCINVQNDHVARQPQVGEWDELLAQSWGDEPEGYDIIHGNLGWHVTWMLLLDLTEDPIVGYETYGVPGSNSGAFGSQPVPQEIEKALSACGAVWGGLWPERLSGTHEPEMTLGARLLPPRSSGND